MIAINKDLKNKIDQYGKIPPQAIDVEAAVLGALLLESEAFQSISTIIREESFYKEEHKRLFSVIKSIASENKPVDLLIVTQKLKDCNMFDEVGGPAYITQLTRQVASAAHIQYHARIIAQKHLQREMIKASTEIQTKAYDDMIDVDDIISDWIRRGDELENTSNIADTGVFISDVLAKTIEEIEEDCKRNKENKTTGIPTGFKSFDFSSGGWRPGNFIVLAARTGVGKTSFALFFALTAAKAGYWVNLFSLEMSKEDLARILLASESGVYRSNIRDGVLGTEDWPKLNEAIAHIENLPIIFHDASGINVNQIHAAIRKNKKNSRCDFAIVDYLQLVKPSANKQIRELEVSEISRTLKSTALEEKIPILALSQLNRSADNETPKLSHLRESGAIEQDADLVCFLSKQESISNIIRFTVAKHRRGRLGDIEIHCNDEMTKFTEIT